MKAYAATYKWMPPTKNVPARIQRGLLPFTPNNKGWTIWYAGKTRTICNKHTLLEEVPNRWMSLKARIDTELTQAQIPAAKRPLREALSIYFEWLDYRVATGKPSPLAAISAEDYKRNLLVFGKFIFEGRKFADIALKDFGPEHFKAFAEKFSKRAPSSLARNVVTVYGFFNYCRDEELIENVPNYGRYFVRPHHKQIRDRRMQQKKAWEVEDLWKIVEYADTQEKAWIGLALSGAMDNADIGHLTFSLFDKTGMILDYRRRKTGLVPRIIPLHSMARQWLDDYLVSRPSPADPASKELVFLTPNGLPLQRSTPGKSGVGNHIDYLAHCWDKLLRRAGLRAKAKFIRVCVVCGKPRPAIRAKCCGQGKWKKKLTMAAVGEPSLKGFRSLRTTFANLTPRGFADERKLIMGHSGDITLDHYVERYGIEHLQRLVDEVWVQAFTAPWPQK